MFFSWVEFVRAVATTPIQYPKLKVAYLAQCILESSRGSSFLFMNAGNPTGLKWRGEMQGFAEKISLVTPTEPSGAEWCLWRKPEDAVKGYWHFISRPVYDGWEQFGNDPIGYLSHIWKAGYATDPNYVQKVSQLFPESQRLLDSVGDLSMATATWFLFSRSSNDSSIVHAMSNSTSIDSIISSSKADLINFLNRYTEARTFVVSPNSDQISDQAADSLESNLGNTAIKYQFHRESTGIPAVVAMNSNGEGVDILRSKLKSDLIDFLNKYSGANTYQVAPRDSVDPQPAPGSIDSATKPRIEWVSGCPNFSSRNGQTITSIVLHYTTSRNIDGTISWFLNPSSKVSAHYIIGRDGKIVQMVSDSDKAWHCASFNSNSIGIEHSAQIGDKLTPEQEKSSAALVKWLRKEYGISQNQIFGHRWNPNAPNMTDCPGSLWPTINSLEDWIRRKVL
jgi:hypothetical protein